MPTAALAAWTALVSGLLLRRPRFRRLLRPLRRTFAGLLGSRLAAVRAALAGFAG